MAMSGGGASQRIYHIAEKYERPDKLPGHLAYNHRNNTWDNTLRNLNALSSFNTLDNLNALS